MARPHAVKVFVALAAFVISGIIRPEILGRTNANAQADCLQSDQSGHTLCGRFLQYWQEHGGIALLGYPISEPFKEKSDIDGNMYTVQYFEHAVFELHLENRPPKDVLISLLGRVLYEHKYPTGAPGQVPNTLPGSQLFPQTGKRLGGIFLAYWQSNGGLALQGYPISDEFLEPSTTDGKAYMVQYFERAVFEYHPGNFFPNDVIVPQLGASRLQEKYGDGSSLPPAPGLISSGLGLSQEAWEKIHGRGRPDPTGESSGLFYEGGKYGVFYTSNHLSGAISIGFQPSTTIDSARAESKKLIPLDARLLTRASPPLDGVFSVFFDTYYSRSLGYLFPPGEQALFRGELNSQFGIWLGATPGTFTVKYDIDIHGKPYKTVYMLIYAGGNN